MSYVVTFYNKAVTPVQEFYKTKALAMEALSDDVKSMKPMYKGSGFKQKGSVKSGRVVFEHPCYGVDYLAKIEEN